MSAEVQPGSGAPPSVTVPGSPWTAGRPPAAVGAILNRLAVPLVLLLPGRAGRLLVSASRPAFAALFIAGCIVPPLLIDVLLVRQTARKWQHLAAETGLWHVPYWWAWDEWHDPTLCGRFESLEVILLVGSTALAAAIAFLAWLNLPFVHGRGPVGASYCRALRVSSAVLWPALVVLAGGLAVDHLLWPEWRGHYHLSRDLVQVWLGALAVLGLLAWQGRAIRAVAPAPTDLRPTCVGCGYIVAYLPPGSACPECGRALADSLDASRCRPGTAWTSRPRLRHWPATVLAVVFRPGRFYRRLPVCGPVRPASAFAGWNALLLYVGGAVWFSGVAVVRADGFPYRGVPLADILGEVMFLTLLSIAVTLSFWFGYRVLALLVASLWIARGSLPDNRGAGIVIRYESAFLWPFAACWAALVWVKPGTAFEIVRFLLCGPVTWWFVICGRNLAWWLSRPELLALLLAGVLLIIMWLWRYRIARRAVRWANF